MLYFNFGLIAIIGLVFPLAGFIYFKDIFSSIWPWFALTSICLVAIGFLMLYYLRINKIKPVFYLSVWFIISVIFFGLPMARKIEVNPDYKSVLVVDKYREHDPMPVYEYKNFTPEIIWEYGQPIKRLWEDKNFSMPESNEFLLLNSPTEFESMQETFSNYEIRKIDEIDMNPVGNKHKGRLYRDLYLLKKNDINKN